MQVPRRNGGDGVVVGKRLLFTNGEKQTYTVEEIAELLDKIAAAKDQET